MRAGKPVPPEFADVQLCLLTGWDYWTLKSLPTWFYQRLIVYLEARAFAGRIEEAHDGLKLKTNAGK